MGVIRPNRRCHLFFDFHFQGRRFREGTTLKDTALNRRALEKKLGIIEREIALGIFDYLKWFPEGNHAREFAPKDGKLAQVPFSDYLDRWFETHKKTVKPYTARCYEDAIEGRIKPWAGTTMLQDVSRRMVRELVAEWLGKELSVRTVRNYLKPLRQALEEAVQEELISSNPARDIKLPQASPTDVNPLSYQEMHAFLKKVPKKHKAYFEVAFLTGLRPSEQIALKKRHVDLKRDKILVRESHVKGKEGNPKTRGAVRDVDILPPLKPVLKDQVKASNGSDYLFPSRSGGPLDLRNLRERVWYPTLDKADLRRRVLYQTRHTFASLMISSGEDINWVAKMMGDSVETVLRHYNRFIPQNGKKDGGRFLKLYGVAK